jgi:phospholipid transport system substrate-binding protein
MHARYFVHALALLLLANLAAPCSAADSLEAPSAFVAKLARQALLSANSKTLSSADRRRRLEGLLDEDFDVQRIAGFVLGHYWQKASDADRQNFTAALREFLVRSYSRRFTDYNGGSFRVLGQRAESATSTVVFTEIGGLASGQSIKVAWRVVDKAGYRVVDMSVAGTSMILALRDEFMSALGRNGGDFPGLVQQLETKMSAQQER